MITVYYNFTPVHKTTHEQMPEHTISISERDIMRAMPKVFIMLRRWQMTPAIIERGKRVVESQPVRYTNQTGQDVIVERVHYITPNSKVWRLKAAVKALQD